MEVIKEKTSKLKTFWDTWIISNFDSITSVLHNTEIDQLLISGDNKF